MIDTTKYYLHCSNPTCKVSTWVPREDDDGFCPACGAESFTHVIPWGDIVRGVKVKLGIPGVEVVDPDEISEAIFTVLKEVGLV